MGIIRKLPQSVVNQIAAGEVIERPASLAKELLENAIDAAATRIDVSVERGGKDLVRVSDDGVGIAPDELTLAFQPHTTSKLESAEDLFRIRTLGFRGEALASIAEVAKIRCQSRQAAASEGSELTIEGGIAGPVKSYGCPPGTCIEVRNLFYNIPVRRAFLKSDLTESGHVAEMFSRIALAHPEVHLTYRSGGKVVYDLPAVTGTRERIATFFGRELAESLLWVEGRFDDLNLWGYVAHPSQSRSTAKGQYLFIGGRYVRDRALSHALNEAYRGLLMTGRMPVAFLHLEISPEDVDVNVHPTKVEVRFRDPQRIYSHLLSTLRQTFLKSDLHARLQAASEPDGMIAAETGSSSCNAKSGTETGRVQAGGAGQGTASAQTPTRYDLDSGPIDRQTVASWFASDRPRPPAPESIEQPRPREWAASLPISFPVGPSEAFDEFSSPPSRFDPLSQASGATRLGEPVVSDLASVGGGAAAGAPDRPGAALPDSETGVSGDRAELRSLAASQGDAAGAHPLAERQIARVHAASRALASPRAIQIHDSYLVVETSDGVMVIDQHALHERILYEEMRSRVSGGQIESQRLLAPLPVDLTASEATLVLEHGALLAQFGLEVESFGGGTVVVRSLPAMLARVVPDRLVRDLAEHLRTQPLPPSHESVVASLLQMLACKAAVKAGQSLSPDEIAALLERRDLVADSHHCPHGRPTALVFTKADLEKQFGRT
jgi:DNA mismatch repair protein MutL